MKGRLLAELALLVAQTRDDFKAAVRRWRKARGKR